MIRRFSAIRLRLVWVGLCGLVLAAVAEAGRLRIVGGNITSGNAQSYDPGHGGRIFQGLAPDVVLIQEFNYGTNSAADIRSFVTARFGAGFSYFRETGAQIPNGIISRYPILASGEWTDAEVSNRDFSWARIDIPGNKDLWAVSVHFLTASASVRNDEAEALVSYIQANVPAGDYLVVGGDFNSDSRSESQFSTLAAVVGTAGPHPADRNGNQNTNAGRSKPYDSVFADGDLRAYQVPVVIGSSTFTNGLVADTRVYSPIAEISPALTGDSGATNMQHMAIVKDFLLPDPLLIPTPSPLAGGIVGAAYSQTVSAQGGTAPYVWSLAAGALPTGLGLGGGGVLAGTPSAVGTFNFTVKVADGAGASLVKSFTVTVREPLAVYLEANGIPPGEVAEDADFDGVPTLVEYVLGGNPADGDPAILPRLARDPETGRLSFRFSVIAAMGSVRWKVQWSENFVSWTDVVSGENGAVITSAPGTGGMHDISVGLPAPEGRRFLRLSVGAPP